jgi:hypothetical protein
MWFVAYTVICGVGLVAFVISFFQYVIDPTLEVVLGISIGESVSLFTLWVRCTLLNSESSILEFV